MLSLSDGPSYAASTGRLFFYIMGGEKVKADPAKVEAFRAGTGNPLIAPGDPTIRAVASDVALDLDRPVFDLNDTRAIADFILAEVGL